LLAAFLLSGCAHQSTAPTHVALPGYHCSLPDHSGRERATAELRSDGSLYRQNLELRIVLDFNRLSLTMSERIGREYHSPPIVSAWLNYPTNPVDTKDAPRTQLAISTEDGPSAFAFARFRGQETKGRNAAIHFAFGDLLALAKGSDRLFLLARDASKGEVSSTPLPIEKIRFAERKFAALREDLEMLRANYKENCRQIDDLDPGMSIIT
jgi:hypothetical protein